MKHLEVILDKGICNYSLFQADYDRNTFTIEMPGSSKLGYLYKNIDNSYHQFVPISYIVHYIGLFKEYILKVKWKMLLEKDLNIKDSYTSPSWFINWSEDIVKELHGFDDEDFWRYGTCLFANISIDFIRLYSEKINFNKDEPSKRYISQTREYFEFPSNLCLSQSEIIAWDINLIEEFSNFWNWNYLTINKSILWSIDWIIYFDNKLNFILLSSRTDIEWSIDLIDKYFTKWDWVELSVNPSLPWSLDFIERYIDKWTWKPHQDWLKYLRGNSYLHLKPKSISHNTGIRWTKHMQHLIPRVDVWSIAANAFMSQFFISLVAKQLDESRVIYTRWIRYSDYPLEEEEVAYSGWELIRLNKNMLLE